MYINAQDVKRRNAAYQLQTRSADEPMTKFVTCLNLKDGNASRIKVQLYISDSFLC